MKIEIDLPDWLILENQKLPECLRSLKDRMRTVIHYSRLNFQRGTGGPFAAGIFEKESGKILAMGVNRVVPTSVSAAHAEIVAISLAQQKLAYYDLGGAQMPDYQIVVNGRPCAMCFGAIPWSGIRSVVIGASGEQIESIAGFDEGPIHPQWRDEYRKRGIEIIENILAEEACQAFREFIASGQPVYNARRGNRSE